QTVNELASAAAVIRHLPTRKGEGLVSRREPGCAQRWQTRRSARKAAGQKEAFPGFTLRGYAGAYAAHTHAAALRPRALHHRRSSRDGSTRAQRDSFGDH